MSRINYTNGYYEGDVVDGKPNGEGTYYLANGNRYEGDVVDGKPNGKGTYYWANGNRYEGDFVNDQRTGKGTCYWANGDRYEGNWKDDKRTGKGIYYFHSGNRYEGDFYKNEMQGQGTFYYINGEQYEGSFFNNQMNGPGIFCWTNGNRYEGSFKNDKKNGKGIFYLNNGDRYEGFWKNDKKQGEGNYYTADGKCFIRVYNNEKLISSKEVTPTNNNHISNSKLNLKSTSSQPKAYNGDKPYIFISYAHKDEETVFPIISFLQDNGYRVWYDEGINPGTASYLDLIEKKIANCSFFISMYSKNYIESNFCNMESKHPDLINLNRMVVFLDNSELIDGLRMLFGICQNLYKNELSEAEFHKKLLTIDNIQICKE